MAKLKMVHAVDPREELMAALGDLSDIKIFNNYILVAVYKRPERLASGLFISDVTRKEDDYQGKVGLVVKKGPLAFEDDDRTSFRGQNVDVGDWIAFRVSDGWSLEVNGVMCRMLQDIQIRLRLPAPDVIL